MRIVCPECAAEYEVPSERLAPGRAVRCAKCRKSWAPLPAASPISSSISFSGPDQAAHLAGEPVSGLPKGDLLGMLAMERPRDMAAAPAEPATGEAPRPGPESEPAGADRGRAGTALLAWILSLLLLGAAVAAAIHWRGALSEAWPPMARLFLALGLTV